MTIEELSKILSKKTGKKILLTKSRFMRYSLGGGENSEIFYIDVDGRLIDGFLIDIDIKKIEEGKFITEVLINKISRIILEGKPLSDRACGAIRLS